jgi:hypothetical protein
MGESEKMEVEMEDVARSECDPGDGSSRQALKWALQVLDTLTSSVEWLQERAATAGWPVPDAPEELVAWALDEMAIQIDQARDHPEEAAERLPFGAEMAFLAAVLLWNSALPAPLPWEREEERPGEDVEDVMEALTGFGIETAVARELAARCTLAQVQGWIEYARSDLARNLTNPQGLVVKRLREGVPAPQVRSERERHRDYLGGAYGHLIQH